MSADGDTVRAGITVLDAIQQQSFERLPVRPMLAALARLEAAEANYADALAEALRRIAGSFDAARAWQDNYNAAEAQRDALAEALQRISEWHEPNTATATAEIARAALAETGLG